MALPKAVLCLLDNQNSAGASEEETALRNAGFATATIPWSEVRSEINGWMQLVQILDEEAVIVLAFAGKPESFSTGVKSAISALLLALERKQGPALAFILDGDERELGDLPQGLEQAKVYRRNQPYASKLMVLRVRPEPKPELPFHIKAHLHPMIGQWFEMAPPDGERWEGFMAGVTKAEVVAFGVGPRGIIPDKSTLEFPMFGIKGDFRDVPFSACAAKNVLDRDISCYLCVDGEPESLFCTSYPDDDPGRPIMFFDLA